MWGTTWLILKSYEVLSTTEANTPVGGSQMQHLASFPSPRVWGGAREPAFPAAPTGAVSGIWDEEAEPDELRSPFTLSAALCRMNDW